MALISQSCPILLSACLSLSGTWSDESVQFSNTLGHYHLTDLRVFFSFLGIPFCQYSSSLLLKVLQPQSDLAGKCHGWICDMWCVKALWPNQILFRWLQQTEQCGVMCRNMLHCLTPILLHITQHCSVCCNYFNTLWSNSGAPVHHNALYCVLQLFKQSLVQQQCSCTLKHAVLYPAII